MKAVRLCAEIFKMEVEARHSFYDEPKGILNEAKRKYNVFYLNDDNNSGVHIEVKFSKGESWTFHLDKKIVDILSVPALASLMKELAYDAWDEIVKRTGMEEV